ncbi:Ankyrin repeat-containing protein [Morus notabilis]|uniref:Ankyrin repeat-containing protein n=1 Tax=Morus notabilis TaxID=981085 RepID=W9QFX0_9ROSA|nr:Ankyrin repeat-containing protein [Morus notabilis]
MSALHISARSGQSRVIKILIDERPDVCELLDNKDRTALHVAVENAQRNAVKILLDVMAFRDLINKQDIEGNTALHLAAIHEHYEILEILAADGITFAAAVQVPGGYDDEGMANLKDKASFKYFLVYNFMGFGFAAGTLLIHFTYEMLPTILRVSGLQHAFTGTSAAFQFVKSFTLCSIFCTVFGFIYATNTVSYDNVSKLGFSDFMNEFTWTLGLPATVTSVSLCCPCFYLLYHLGRLYCWVPLKVLCLEYGALHVKKRELDTIDIASAIRSNDKLRTAGQVGCMKSFPRAPTRASCEFSEANNEGMQVQSQSLSEQAEEGKDTPPLAYEMLGCQLSWFGPNNSGVLHPSSSKASIVLIPKIEVPATTNDSASLCNFIYKIISKIHASRTKHIG